tara:strand:- start:44 stop:520 length:477 start_codon:yes stop_codon:yes gene_type:complete
VDIIGKNKNAVVLTLILFFTVLLFSAFCFAIDLYRDSRVKSVAVQLEYLCRAINTYKKYTYRYPPDELALIGSLKRYRHSKTQMDSDFYLPANYGFPESIRGDLAYSILEEGGYSMDYSPQPSFLQFITPVPKFKCIGNARDNFKSSRGRACSCVTEW